MDVDEALDREVIVERAEALRIWLVGLSLSRRALSAFERELDGIIANDPGGYINGARPLAGMTSDDFVAELQRPGAGAVGQVRSVGDSVLAELRAALAPAEGRGVERDGEAPDAEDLAEPAPRAARRRARRAARADGPPAASPELAGDESPAAIAEAEPAPRRRGRPRKAPAVAAPAPAPDEMPAATAEAPAAAPDVPTADEAPATEAPRRRGRPRKAPAVDGPPVEAPRRRGRPRATPAPLGDGRAAPAPRAPQLAAPPAPGEAVAAGDPLLAQLARLWPMLHPQARRAILLYTGTLLIEGQYGEGGA